MRSTNPPHPPYTPATTSQSHKRAFSSSSLYSVVLGENITTRPIHPDTLLSPNPLITNPLFQTAKRAKSSKSASRPPLGKEIVVPFHLPLHSCARTGRTMPHFRRATASSSPILSLDGLDRRIEILVTVEVVVMVDEPRAKWSPAIKAHEPSFTAKIKKRSSRLLNKSSKHRLSGQNQSALDADPGEAPR